MYTPEAEQIAAITVPCRQCGSPSGELCSNGGANDAPLFNGPAHGKDGFRSRTELKAALKAGRAARIHSHQRRVNEFHAHVERVRLGKPSWDKPKGIAKYEVTT
jgi:hypothetical protein